MRLRLVPISFLLATGFTFFSASSGFAALQAESASSGGGTVIEHNYAGYNGSGFANLPNSGGWVEFTNVDGGSGGSATLTIRYAQGSGTRKGALIVNGATQAITFGSTGAWDTWKTQSVTVSLKSGATNTIRLQSNGQDFPNVDEISVDAASGGGSSSASSNSLQAESASYGGGTVVEKNYGGYKGSGFVNLPSSGGYVQFNNVDGGSGGTATIEIRYAQGSGTRTGALLVNGAKQSVTFGATGAWDTWKTQSVAVSLKSGTANTIRLESNGQDFPNVDEITVTTGSGSSGSDSGSSAAGSFQAESASYGGGTVIEHNYSGYHGSGFANLPNSGGYLEFAKIDGGSGGSTTLAIRYAQPSGSRTGSLIVNGSKQSITFNATGSWDTWKTQSVSITLKSGATNTIRFESNGQDFPNVDEIVLGGGGASTPTIDPIQPPDGEVVTIDDSLLSIFNSNGTISAVKYAAAALLWDVTTASSRLGPTFADLNPRASDDRPTLFKPTTKSADSSYCARIGKYEVGSPGSWSNYWSTSGQVGYVPDSPATNPGLDRIQTFAFYNHAYALSPRLDPMATRASPDPQTLIPSYAAMNGERPTQPIAMVRNYGLLSNEALVLYRDGLLASAGTQTSRSMGEQNFPSVLFPENKIPTSIAVTTLNEFALVTVWDTTAMKGQLAVIALEGKYLAHHTWPYMGFPNQGSWSDFKLLGYIDLPMAAPSSVSAASNGWWESPGTTGGKTLAQIDLTNDSNRKLLWDGNWQGVIATKGYAVVASKQEGKVCFVDLTPLFAYMKTSYLSSVSTFKATLASRGSGSTQFPKTFSALPSIKPTVVYTTTVAKPTAVLAGVKLNRWTQDRHKAYVASEDGTITVFDTSSLRKRWDYEKLGPLEKMGTFKVGRNPVSMAFMRFNESGLPLVPTNSDGTVATDPLNGMFYVACRGERDVEGVVSFGGKGSVFRRIRDKRMGDPVAVSVTDRANIVTVADFNGKKILSFRVGKLTDASTGKVYGPGSSGTDKFEFAGELALPGHPFLVGSSNVN
ncbi:carbohydrate-binding protein [Horticoccus luteus]|uniref:Carbohydrate-binding protein n=1 Tax=Horticoccus luteus TaxID=2862869 RepID=A0A8F9TV49_9BACT|nr:carbohydrate-binding protein [Horticoccus luteus]QYM78152.1 carbohydrate-binding protein [Horticoccus luteus]